MSARKKKAETAARRRKSSGLTLADIERAMGQKADAISEPRFDPELMAWTREITFNLKKDGR